MILTANNFQRVENHNSYEENGEIIEESVHQAWILDIGDVNEKVLEQVRDEILKAIYLKKKLDNFLKEIQNIRQNRAYDNQYWHLSFLELRLESLLGDKN